MTRYEMIMERASFYGIEFCESFKNDIEFILMEGRREGNRIKEVLEVLENEKEGIAGKEIGERLGIKGPNVASVVMEIRKRGTEVFSVNGKYILGKFVNIG